MSGAHGRSPRRFPLRRVARLAGWNVLILFALLLLAGGGAELWLRLTVPFRGNVLPVQLVPGVGVMRPPHAEMRYTNGRDFWQVSRTNSLGFLDREPPDAERAAESCHVTLIGDSFVEGREAPLGERAQVRLEELAARELPELDVTTSAFGRSGTAQINQLAFYDRWARTLSPDVVVLVFAGNDFRENSLVLSALSTGGRGFHPDHPPYVFARRGADGEMAFVPPSSDLGEIRANAPPASAGRRIEGRLRRWSYVADWLWTRRGGNEGAAAARRRDWAETIGRNPRHAPYLEGWDAGWTAAEMNARLFTERPPLAFRDALDVAGFAFGQFRERAERDGVALVVLANYSLGGDGGPWFERLRVLAGGISVISHHDRIAADGGTVGDARWEHDGHWNAAGHRWAAEAVLEWLKRNPEACG